MGKFFVYLKARFMPNFGSPSESGTGFLKNWNCRFFYQLVCVGHFYFSNNYTGILIVPVYSKKVATVKCHFYRNLKIFRSKNFYQNFEFRWKMWLFRKISQTIFCQLSNCSIRPNFLRKDNLRVKTSSQYVALFILT